MNSIEASKFLSYILRHQPEAIDLTLDIEGWANINTLIEASKNKGNPIDLEMIKSIVTNSDKKRFEISEDDLHIRAIQGHSTASVSRSYPEKIPPETLYHGTATRYLKSIRAQGLRAGTRHFVHLSENPRTATAVGQRHGNPVVLKIEALRMHHQGFKFFLAENGVWLADSVPASFIYEQSLDELGTHPSTH